MVIALKVFNFPPMFTNVDVREFLHLFGLQATRQYRRRSSHGAIVNVANESEVRLVIARLHQLLIASHRLKVEYCDEKKVSSPDHHGSLLVDCKVAPKRRYSDAIDVGRATLNYAGFPPPYLIYRYPKHSPTILDNISSELASNPSFYYQVLHLMNKMNLKTPFQEQEREQQTTTTEAVLCANQPSSDEESELESDNEMNGTKRFTPSNIQPTMKVVNYDNNLLPQQNTDKKRYKRPNIAIHISGESFNIDEASNAILHTAEVATLALAVSSHDSIPEKECPTTLENVLHNRIPDEQRQLLTVFKNYTPGDPTNKLYIKNLAKTVTEEDLQQIVSIFFEKESLKEINVKLMKTGRMKGQAFISFLPMDGDTSSTRRELNKCIARALSTLNGYILKDKPMVVSYAKST